MSHIFIQDRRFRSENFPEAVVITTTTTTTATATAT
jgi:hypothetical protein